MFTSQSSGQNQAPEVQFCKKKKRFCVNGHKIKTRNLCIMKIDKWRYKLWCLKIHKAINCKDQSSAIKYSILGPLKIVDILVQICHIFIQFDMKPLNWSFG